MIAGFTIFGILGHLAHELGTDDIESVVNGGPGIAFISYPEAIARFDWAPQVTILPFSRHLIFCHCLRTQDLVLSARA